MANGSQYARRERQERDGLVSTDNDKDDNDRSGDGKKVAPHLHYMYWPAGIYRNVAKDQGG